MLSHFALKFNLRRYSKGGRGVTKGTVNVKGQVSDIRDSAAASQRDTTRFYSATASSSAHITVTTAAAARSRSGTPRCLPPRLWMPGTASRATTPTRTPPAPSMPAFSVNVVAAAARSRSRTPPRAAPPQLWMPPPPPPPSYRFLTSPCVPPRPCMPASSTPAGRSVEAFKETETPCNGSAPGSRHTSPHRSSAPGSRSTSSAAAAAAATSSAAAAAAGARLFHDRRGDGGDKGGSGDGDRSGRGGGSGRGGPVYYEQPDMATAAAFSPSPPLESRLQQQLGAHGLVGGGLGVEWPALDHSLMQHAEQQPMNDAADPPYIAELDKHRHTAASNAAAGLVVALMPSFSFSVGWYRFRFWV